MTRLGKACIKFKIAFQRKNPPYAVGFGLNV